MSYFATMYNSDINLALHQSGSRIPKFGAKVHNSHAVLSLQYGISWATIRAVCVALGQFIMTSPNN